MRRPVSLTRVVLSGAVFAVCAVACQTVLDIQDPKMRPTAVGGEGGEPTVPSGAGRSGNVTMPIGGEGGTEPVPTMSGAGGEAGATTTKECDLDAVQCGGGETAKTPQICDETGHWVTNTEEADGDCAVTCDAGKCVECVAADSPRCAVCEDGDANCNTNQPQSCVDGVWVDQGDKPCAQFCDGGVCKTAPSCDALDADRTTCQQAESCCKSLRVPGGTFTLTDEDSGDSSAAKISAFNLDRFEVTVGRMRQFVSAFDELKLKNGAGKSLNAKDDPGWDTDYQLPADKDALVSQLKCSGTNWSDNLLANNDLPVNCVPFNVAYAFCIWDGARLPTEAEWNFAAAGGDEQRAYPWKPPIAGPTITDAYANYGNANLGTLAVGSKPLGDGRWGHADLAGNVAEWVLDYRGDYPQVCEDCVNETPALERVERGGGYTVPAELLLGSARSYVEPAGAFSVLGFRCARDLN